METELYPGLHPVLATPGGLQQILLNLAANARDAMPNGGKVVISTCNLIARNPEDTVNVDAAPCALLQVRDTGAGIAPEYLGRLFEPFFTTKELGKGVGMGLATVYGLVKQRGGWITVDSEIGCGTAFRIYFPAGAVAPLPSTVPGERSESNGRGVTILLAEDQTEIRSFACEVLQSSGYNVIEARDSREALEQSLRFPGRIDLLVSDVVNAEYARH